MQLNGARILIECLIREGVNIIFGYPGGSVLDIYDELPQYGEQLRHVLVRHEQAAVHAADGYARATGKVGVCMAASGPGATNTVTGIATAYCDSIPMVIFTGQVPTGLIGNDAFQEVDIAGITRPCTKHNYVVKDVKDTRQGRTAGLLSGPFRASRPRACGPAQERASGFGRIRLARRREPAQLQPDLPPQLRPRSARSWTRSTMRSAPCCSAAAA